MKRIARTLIRVGGILAIVYAACFALAMVVFIVLATPVFTQTLVDGLSSAKFQSDIPGTPEEQALAIQIMFGCMAFAFALLAGFGLASAIVSFKCLKEDNKKGLYIANIVFGILSGSSLNTAGGVLGTIALTRQERRDRRNNVVDAQ